jgi:hypothetical protein
MKEGDLVYLKPKNQYRDNEEEFIGLVIHQQQVGSFKGVSTILYDVLLTETNEVITISDIYFKIRRIE